MSRTDDRDALLVADIVGAADKLAQIVREGREAFDNDWKARHSAERLLEIIGEAADRLSDDFQRRIPQLRISDAKKTRNFVIHHYSRVDYDEIWDTILISVPQFVADLTGR